jgi:uncharacterized protein (TIGR02284 family)
MSNETLSTLNELIETSKDGEQGFNRAAQKIEDVQLQSTLQECATRCATAAGELQEVVRSLGEKPETGGSALGAVHRGWLDFKASITDQSKETAAVLEECERGEDYAKERFEEALAGKELPPLLRDILMRQYHGVVKNHDLVRGLRNRYARP